MLCIVLLIVCATFHLNNVIGVPIQINKQIISTQTDPPTTKIYVQNMPSRRIIVATARCVYYTSR